MGENGQEVRFADRPVVKRLREAGKLLVAIGGVVGAVAGVLSYAADQAERAEARRARTTTLPQEREPASSISPTFSSSSQAPTERATPSTSETGTASVPTPATSRPAQTKTGTMPRYFIGVWSGTLTQGGSSYAVRLRLQDGEIGEPVGTIEYETLHCAGELKLRTASPRSLDVVETLTNSAGCTPEGNIALKRNSNGSLSYSYFHSDGSVSTTGTLKRAGS